MYRIPDCVLFISLFFLVVHTTSSVDGSVRNILITFLNTLANSDGQTNSSSLFGWNSTSDPCTDGWSHVICNHQNTSVTKLHLDGLNLNGTLVAGALCNDQSLANSLTFLDIDGNNIVGGIPDEIGNCKHLSQLRVSSNRMSGTLPGSLSKLINLKSLNLSNNNFSGNLPNLVQISGLNLFLAQYNQLSGEIPGFDFSNLVEFNVSYNNFSGCIPDVNGLFNTSSFLGNPGLSGDPLSTKCLGKKSKTPSKDQILMYLGYAVLGLLVLGFLVFRLCKRKKIEVNDEQAKNIPEAATGDGINRSSTVTTVLSSEVKTEEASKRPEFSGVSIDQSLVSSSLVLLKSPSMNGLEFEDLLRAPAELLGRGKHGTLYKVTFENGMNLVVKRIKDWAISNNDFKERMQRIDQVKHPNLLPAIAFYSSKHEKLLVYKYQQNGSLFKLLHASGQAFDWSSRLGAMARIVSALAYAHQELHQDGIAHGNLKSSNILFNNNMDILCISEYGLMPADEEEPSIIKYLFKGESNAFREDIYGFGVILLELLTGKVVQRNGSELANWVHSVVREEWTAEVFDKSLVMDGASEERMVNVLQVALKCVDSCAEARPGIKQVATMINTIKEEDERSTSFSEV